MTTITTGAVLRSVVREADPPEDDDTLDALGEIEQQFQIAISGTATTTIGWESVDLTFDVEFLDATDQRYSNLTVPHVKQGQAVTSITPVVVTLNVGEWTRDDRDVIVGCVLDVGVSAGPGGTPAVYTGYAHLTLQGYGSVPNEPADPEFNPTA